MRAIGATMIKIKQAAWLPILAGIGFFFVCAYIVIGTNLCTPQQKYAATEQDADSNCRIYESGNVFTCPKLLGPLPEKTTSNDNANGDQYKYGSWAKIFICESKLSDIAIAFFTYCLILVGYFQAYWLQKTVDATLIAAEAAQKSAEMIPTMEAAYVFPANIVARIKLEPPWPDPPPRYVECAIVFRNYGRTPANIALAAITIRILDHIPTTEDGRKAGTIERASSDIYKILGTDAPNRDWSIADLRSEESVTPHSFEQLTKERIHVYCWGQILYRDIFSTERSTNFCFRYDMKRNEFHPVGGFDRNNNT